MSDATSQFWFWLILIYSIFIPSSSAEQENIPAAPGQNVTLTCRAPNNNIILVEWRRAELTPEFVFVYRNKQFDPENQHPSFKNRVDLKDRQMKDGDVSVILKNVTINDTGTYECRVQREDGTMELMNTTYLSVASPPGPTGGTTEDGGSVGLIVLIVGLSVSAGLLSGFGVLIHKRCRKQGPDPKQLPAEHQLEADLQTYEEKLLEVP